MPTAILIIPTLNGFVAASDGFGGRGDASSKHEVKLFPIVSCYGHFIYGISGMASFLEKDKKTDVFKCEYMRAIAAIEAKSGLTNLIEYAHAFVEAVAPKMDAILAGDAIRLQFPYSTSNAPPIDTRVHFAGYFKGVQSMATCTISFWRDTWCAKVEAPDSSVSPRRCILDGSEEVRKRILNGDADFSEYQTSGFTKMNAQDESITRPEAIDAAREYIKACMTDKARAIDPDHCAAIAGDVRVATLTEAGDFCQWVEVPAKI